MPLPLVRGLPAYALNGITVALGIGCIQLLFGVLAGPHPAQLAVSGAVCASLADTPNTVSRSWYRVSAAAALGFLAALTVALLKPHPIALGIGIMLIAFLAMMTMAWGARAGPVSFAPILSLVFSMAVPPSSQPVAVLAGWNALGGIAYLAWSLAAAALLQPRYRTAALVETLRAAAQLFRSRAGMLEAPSSNAGGAGSMRAWIQGEAALGERLQSARDLIFAAADSTRSRRDTAILLRVIDLRDVLLASRLDLDLLGGDPQGRWMLERVAKALREIAAALDRAAQVLRDDAATPAHADSALQFGVLFEPAPIAPDDPRARLLPAVIGRLQQLSADIARIHALLSGEPEELPLTRSQLQRFVADEGWPLRVLRAQLSTQSPVLRHALRTGLALGSAYFLALALPWASHPHWLVLSVAVVLRGNLEQTLSRRNARVLGTLLGCLTVVLLSGVRSPVVLGLAFLAAVGVAHSFVMQRYWLTAAAATVMALLQSHMADPAGGFAIAERVADTLLGALLAWGFSYVLPSWERRSLPQAIGRVLKEIENYAAHALALKPGDVVEQRLARRRAYDALATLAAMMQRSGAEPERVRLPLKEIAVLLDYAQRLMAHLSMVRLMLARRSDDTEWSAAAPALQQTYAALSASFDLQARSDGDGMDGNPEELASLPVDPPARDVMPWLLRRLQVLVHDALRIRRAAASALAIVNDERATPSLAASK